MSTCADVNDMPAAAEPVEGDLSLGAAVQSADVAEDEEGVCPRDWGVPVRSRSGYGWTIEMMHPVYVRGVFHVACERGRFYMVDNDEALCAVRKVERRALTSCFRMWEQWFGVPAPARFTLTTDYASAADAASPVFESVLGSGRCIKCWAPRKVRGSVPNAVCVSGDLVDGELAVKRISLSRFRVKVDCELRIFSSSSSVNMFR